jgi:uncharacterized YccA/Bax inhibitor family protein
VSAQVLNEATFSESAITTARKVDAAGVMTLAGTIKKSVVLLGITLACGVLGWNQALKVFEQLSGAWFLFGFIALLMLSILVVTRPALALPVGAAYAAFMGIWMGAVSRFYNEVFEGIIGQALLATVGVFLAVLLLYRTGIAKVTNRFISAVIFAMVGILFLYVSSWILTLFDVNLRFWYEPTAVGISFSVIVAIVAAMSLILDFHWIEEGIQAKAPKWMEWYSAFGLISSLIWLYAEVLRLIALSRLTKR